MKQFKESELKPLDEVMFWTYAFDADDIARASICGNIYQNPELLEP